MANVKRKARGRKPAKAKPEKEQISKLGRDLRRIREEIVASGMKLLTRKEVEQEVNDRRGIRG